jgi:hypothetical protein
MIHCAFECETSWICFSILVITFQVVTKLLLSFIVECLNLEYVIRNFGVVRTTRTRGSVQNLINP